VVNGKDTTTVANFSRVKSAAHYLPAGVTWYDFWSGEMLAGAQTVRTSAPIDVIPLYVKAGSILPIGPKVQYATEKKWDDLEIRVYPGADGKSTLYDDENDNYNYEKGAYATIDLSWDDAKQMLTISDRIGSYPGMSAERTFRIVKAPTKVPHGNREHVRCRVHPGRKLKLFIVLPHQRRSRPCLYGIFYDIPQSPDRELFPILLQAQAVKDVRRTAEGRDCKAEAHLHLPCC
jgi:hypothetical protein